MSLTEEEYEAIEDLAGCNYGPNRIAKYLGVDIASFMSAWYNSESEVRNRYDKGQLQSEFLIARKRKENAEKGNLTADQQHTKELERRRNEDIKMRLLYGGAPIIPI